MRIGIINQNTKNYGDDIAGITLIENLLKINDIESIELIYKMEGLLPIENEKINHNKHLKRIHYGKINLILYFLFRKFGYKGKKNSELRNTIEIIDKCDYIFVSPCGANIGIYRDTPFLLRVLFVINERKTPIFYLNTIGSSGNYIFDKIAKFALKHSKVYVREKKSYEYLEKIGVKSKLGVDVAFGFENRNREIRKRENVIGFIPTFLKEWHPNFKDIDIEKKIFEEIIPQIIKFAEERKYKIELIPHMNTVKEKKFYRKVKQEFESRGYQEILIREDVTDAYKYNEIIASCHIIISMRYHGIVLAAKNAIPFLALSYENKMQEVCRYTDMKKYSIVLYNKNDKFRKAKDLLDEIENNIKTIQIKLKNIRNDKLIQLSKLPLKELEESNIGKI